MAVTQRMRERQARREEFGRKKAAEAAIRRGAKSVEIGTQTFVAPTPMMIRFAKIAKQQGWSRPISDAKFAKSQKLTCYQRALPGWSVGKELTGDARCNHCKVMKPDSKRPFKECVVVKGFWNGACANCYHYEHGHECDLYDQTKKYANMPREKREVLRKKHLAALKETSGNKSPPTSNEARKPTGPIVLRNMDGSRRMVLNQPSA